MRILFITDTMPYPPVSGNRLRVYHLCRRMARENELWLAVPWNGPEDEAGLAHMREFCHEVITAPRQHESRARKLIGMVGYALRGWPPELYFDICKPLADKLREVTAAEAFDVVHIEPSYIALYRQVLAKNAEYRITLSCHNVIFSLFRLVARVERAPLKRLRAFLNALALRRWEPRYLQQFDRCIMVSEDDERLLLRTNPRLNTIVSPNGVDVSACRALAPLDGPPAVLFVGSMNYAPCSDAVLWFCREILPKVRAQVPGLEMWIVGRNPAPKVQALACNCIHVTGWVDDVQSFYARSTVVVVPLRAGGGTRLKVLEAMALGRAVVSTTLGCEGIKAAHGKHLLIADTAPAFAQETVRLLTDASLRDELTRQARTLVVENYSWDAITHNLLGLYAELQ